MEKLFEMTNASARSPYPGPRPFEPDESELFFGRDCEERDLFSLITAHNAVLLYAQSGTGKTSLVNAGLIPLLRKDSYDVLPPARVFGAGPQDGDHRSIANVFTYNVALRWLSEPRESLERLTLQEVFARVPHDPGAELRVLVFDQFEELFTTQLDRWRDRQPFFEQLGQLLGSNPAARVLFVLREDYLAQIEPLGKLLTNHLRARMRLERLGEEAALAAITEPLAKQQRHFEEGVAEELVADLLRTRVEVAPGRTAEVVGEYVEPVQLQLVCESLWRHLGTAETIRQEHVRAVGNIDSILSDFYEEAVAAAAERSGVSELDLRTWFEKALITSMGTRGTVYRGPATTGEILNEAVDELERRHTIRAEWRAGARWYELTHDRFIEPVRASNRIYFEVQAQYAEEHALYELVTQAQQAWQRKRPDEALRLFVRAYEALHEETSPRLKAYIFYILGSLYCELQRPDDAVPLLQMAGELYAGLNEREALAGTLEQLAWIAHEREDFDQAISLLNRAIALTPDVLNLYALRGGSFWYSGKLAEAIADYDTILERDPNYVNAYNGRGQVYLELNEFHKAVADLDHVIETEHTDQRLIAYALNGRGRAWAALRQWEKVEADFTASLAIAPNNGWAFFNRAFVHHWRGDDEKALADLRTALEKKDPALNPLKRFLAEEILGGCEAWPS